MNLLNLQYLTDSKGQKKGIQLSIKDWENIQEDLKELKRLRNNFCILYDVR